MDQHESVQMNCLRNGLGYIHTQAFFSAKVVDRWNELDVNVDMRVKYFE